MSLGVRKRRPAPFQSAVAWAALAVASGWALAAEAQGLRPPDPPPFSALTPNALIETVFAPRTAAVSVPGQAVDLGPFQVLADADAAAATPSPPEAASLAPPSVEPSAIPSAAAPPDPVPTALAAALAQLIVRDDGANPLGSGDWRAARAAIGAFYADRGFQPVWVDADGLTPAGRAVAAQVARAPEDGLQLGKVALPRGLAGPLDPDALARAEVAIAAAVVVYAEQASGSRLSPARISPILSTAPDVADPGAALAATAAAPDPGARLADFNPPQKGYRGLREALARIDEAQGRSGAGVELSGSAADAPAVPDDPLMGAASGRRARGRVAVASAAEGSRRAPARERAAILANMEMWRWEPRDMGERRIEVNIPDYSVAVMDGDAVVMSTRVVVGKPDTPTPVFSNVMRYVLINPSWQVPDSIIKKEILPRLDHFARLGYEVKTVGGRVVVRQPPGQGNALGRFAFMFPNDHSVYLHDTPSRALFDEDMRALSHGCVRVEDPQRLAEIVLEWPEARVEAAIGRAERTVFLPRPLPVHIEYFTAFVDADGTLEQRPDVYGLTQRVASTLSAAGQD
ncbi:murein L,D-transpeptidase YcbB/YkuD [Roseiarcus fermentans]|uniref:Murein L,D-transpeptidase YcbB/YkuD n=1 Tax=Roseiarcus fermentans TaxID=1473586 RepID=A0A366EV91_9HYPH|nr:L,D-transpeptidase family protein [Roseiarcus fermentans]RBP06298.1 murein L,D-transpeptidase YcbB/YkuD [Roseiarcus fermentans]